MTIQIWIVIMVLITIASLYFQNKEKNEQIDWILSNHKREKEDRDNEISKLKDIISKYEDLENGIAQREKLSEKAIETKRRDLDRDRYAQDLELEKNKRLFAQEMKEMREDAQRRITQKTDELRTLEQTIDAKRKAFNCERHALDLELAKNRRLFEQELQEIQENENLKIAQKIDELRNREQIIEISKSNLSSIPYMAGIVADFDTRGLEILARQLDWGHNQERMKKVQSIRELRKETTEMLAQYKEAQYQLQYAIKMFPALSDFLETEYNQLPNTDFSDVRGENHDAVRDYLSREEYAQLSPTERNQLALDRYRESRRKTNWQIGRDYELYVGYKYSQKGYIVDYYGANHGLEDLGRDIIAKKGNETLIIQCKYWSSKKQIHENHVNQLFGTMVCYCLEHNLPKENVKGVLITNITLSETARQFAKHLSIVVVENYPIDNYPCIKCNINRSPYGDITKIYHLPFDQQYDACKIDSPGEFFALTVAEAENAGFRRAFRWHSNN